MQVGAGGAFVQTYPTGVAVYPSTIPMSNNFGTYPPSYNPGSFNAAPNYMGPPNYSTSYSSQPFAANNNLNKF